MRDAPFLQSKLFLGTAAVVLPGAFELHEHHRDVDGGHGVRGPTSGSSIAGGHDVQRHGGRARCPLNSPVMTARARWDGKVHFVAAVLEVPSGLPRGNIESRAMACPAKLIAKALETRGFNGCSCIEVDVTGGHDVEGHGGR